MNSPVELFSDTDGDDLNGRVSSGVDGSQFLSDCRPPGEEGFVSVVAPPRTASRDPRLYRENRRRETSRDWILPRDKGIPHRAQPIEAVRECSRRRRYGGAVALSRFIRSLVLFVAKFAARILLTEAGESAVRPMGTAGCRPVPEEVESPEGNTRNEEQSQERPVESNTPHPVSGHSTPATPARTRLDYSHHDKDAVVFPSAIAVQIAES